ncbi:Ltp family lipoprotein [Microbacterium hydrocarbonoxydans]|uniref:Ltp family lipoprotein n=1 Tax=Microbacterium hydrocarbonoxydans TaxID=273678 RepID=UPI00203E719F|nr:Ltp family lipoprotein [Microbacterium hydrocarbonoxydans]MCM3778388.1 Ltp family lipoprotein [Microbacterium hydrocarbonoxydans]
MTNPNPAPGWYPAPHANNEQRYWDGVQWLEPQQPSTPMTPEAATVAVPTAALPNDVPTKEYPAGPSTTVDASVPVDGTSAKKSKKKGWIIGGSIAAGVILIGGVANAVGGAGSNNVADEKPSTSTVTAEQTVEEPEPAVMVAVPDVTGLTATEALVALSAAGLNPPVLTTLADPLAKVLATSPAAGTEVEEGTEITLTLEEKPKLTVAQENAIRSAQNYLDFTGFSRSGLIGQLEYEGFSTEDATFAVDNAGADWNLEAAEKAQSYLDFSSFSRDGLYGQLEYEGFLPSEIEYGLAAVGY